MTEETQAPGRNNVNGEARDIPIDQRISRPSKWKQVITRIALAGLIIVSGLGSGYFIWGHSRSNQTASLEMNALMNAVNPKDGFKIQAIYGDVGPRLIAAGAIDQATFTQLYQQAGQPLSAQEMDVLTKGSPYQIAITRENARFLLNYFWALGLTNKNAILNEGPIHQASGGQIDQFASTGGWTIGTKPASELFSSVEIIRLTAEQQARVEDVAKAVYRPCCDNPTHFPDCNHGMAMLGLLELMASQAASTEEMFLAAKYANAFWFPQQTLEQVIFFKTVQKVDYAEVGAKQIVGTEYSSGSGFKQVHQWLDENGYLENAPGSGNNCGV
ncbi:MAG TPA: hypothetical protein PKD55_26135 [Bellilinea sp.]|nr:hypothetical protein [Bellilinea sp.]